MKQQPLMNSGRLDPAQLVGHQYQDEQCHREADPQCQGVHCTIAFALVSHQEYQRGSQAPDDQDKCDGDDNFHICADSDEPID
jgi:hypothetical protein